MKIRTDYLLLLTLLVIMIIILGTKLEGSNLLHAQKNTIVSSFSVFDYYCALIFNALITK